MTPSPAHVHLIGIGGIGLSAIARVLIGRGVRVSGSDQTRSPVTDDLERMGATVYFGHKAENIDGADLVLVTSAAHEDNPESVEARRRHIRVVRRQGYFPELTAGMETIAVAGTHGKTTTTGIIAVLLTNAGLDPTAVVGGFIPELGANARAGNGKYFIVEADEYDRAFLGLTPSIAVVTNIEMDHPDCYRDLSAVAEAFQQFLARVPTNGLVVGCGDGGIVTTELGRISGALVMRYGLEPGNDWRAMDLRTNKRGGTDFAVWKRGERFGEYGLGIPGPHNVQNALAAMAVADHLGVARETIRQTLEDFRGATRRFEVKGNFAGVTVVDDYAHHPSEIRATLSAARARFPRRPIWAVFQPHTFSRTLALLGEFANAFADADHVVVTEIYASREQDPGSISGRQIVERMQHPDARFVTTLDEAVDLLAVQLRPNDILITLGAGDVNHVGVMLGSKLPRAE